MNFTNIAELQNYVRTYNSISILKLGSQRCWQIWTGDKNQFLDPSIWLKNNASRNYIIRIILLASFSNPHRNKNITLHEFNDLIDNYYNWGGHTIAYPNILDQEAEIIIENIKNWESKYYKKVRNWKLKLSDIFDVQAIRPHMIGLFVQRQLAFQNAGVGKPVARILRSIKLIELFTNQSKENFSENFINSTGLSPTIYFKQFLGCLTVFTSYPEYQGFCDFSNFPIIANNIQNMGITAESLKLFIKQNSELFHSESSESFRSRLKEKLKNTSDFYKPFFYNFLLETPIIKIDIDKYYLPDPFSLTESCWNQIELKVLKNLNTRNILSDVFEDYLNNVLFPSIAPNSFQKIPEVKNAEQAADKRADFLIELPNVYIVVECKNSVMYLDTTAYFHPEGIAYLWCHIHSAAEQIAATIKARNLKNKPIIPLILTFYDNMMASLVLKDIIKQTNYCSEMGFSIAPIVNCLHEFEHWTEDRSLDNWAELMIQKYHDSSIKPDNQGHNYKHLKDVAIV